jgi:hypothetical protein
MKNTKKQLAKIYYHDREIKNIDIFLEGFDDYKIFIGELVDRTGKDKITGLSYDWFDDEGKEHPVLYWDIKDHIDKVEINHIDIGVTINWISGMTGSIKSSLFIPMRRILHISTNDPLNEDEDGKQPKDVISR